MTLTNDEIEALRDAVRAAEHASGRPDEPGRARLGTELYSPLRRRVRQRLGRFHQDADDVLQDAMQRCWKAIDEIIHTARSCCAYAYGQADFAIRDYYRKQGRTLGLPSLSDPLEVMIEQGTAAVDGSAPMHLGGDQNSSPVLGLDQDQRLDLARCVPALQVLAQDGRVSKYNPLDAVCIFHNERVSCGTFLDVVFDALYRVALTGDIQNARHDLKHVPIANERPHQRDQDLLSCFDWWLYAALLRAAADGLRNDIELKAAVLQPIAKRIRVTPDGTGWDSASCRLSGAQRVSLEHPLLIAQVLKQERGPQTMAFLRARLESVAINNDLTDNGSDTAADDDNKVD